MNIAMLKNTQSVFDLTSEKLGIHDIIVRNLTAAGQKKDTTALLSKVDCLAKILMQAKSNTLAQGYDEFDGEKPALSALYAVLNDNLIDWQSTYQDIAFQSALDLLKTTNTEDACLIVDDTLIQRDCSKKVDLQTKVYDHNKKTYHKGFTMLSVGLYVNSCNVYIPLTFQLMSNYKGNSSKHEIDGRTKLGRNIKLSYEPKFDVLMHMLKDIKNAGIDVSRLLSDSWFVHPRNIVRLNEAGYELIGMMRLGKTKFYEIGSNQVLTTEEVADSINSQMKDGYKFNKVAAVRHVNVGKEDDKQVPATIVFTKNWNKDDAQNKPIVPIISTDRDLEPEQITSIYSKRWAIEVAYRRMKQNFGLKKGNQSRNITTNIALISLCHLRVLMTTVAQRLFFPKYTFAKVMHLLANEFRLTKSSLESIPLTCSITTAFLEQLGLGHILGSLSNDAIVAALMKAILLQNQNTDIGGFKLTTQLINLISTGNVFGVQAKPLLPNAA